MAEQCHVYSTSIAIGECTALVYKLLSSPGVQHCWDSIQIKDCPPNPIQTGSTWLESRSNALFLRKWCSCAVLEVVPGHSILQKLEDGYNTILIRTTVQQHPAQLQHSMVTQTVECFQQAGKALLPSEKLARMFQKCDQKLLRLRAYLQPCSPGGSASTAMHIVEAGMPVMAM